MEGSSNPNNARAQRLLAETQRSACTHFSQCGEDIAIRSLLEHETTKGLFVDIGAYHPVRFSNTFLLFLAGWRGVNIDANPEAVQLFKELRPEDMSACAFVSDQVEEIDYYYFNEGAYNGHNQIEPALWTSKSNSEQHVKKVERRTTIPINFLLEQCVADQKFDLLTIDAEGTDLKLFMAIDFKRFRPKVICIELALDDWQKEPLKSRLAESGYALVAQYMNSSILQRKD